MIKYGSVCSGVEAATLAWESLGWKPVFFSEVEPFPCAVLQERLGASAPINPLAPEESTSEDDRKMRESWIKQNNLLKKEGIIPNEGDFTKIGNKYAGKIDLLVGGTPCQDVSQAGKRAGFAGERSSLAIDFVRLAYESKCKWVVWENVPGVFSSNGGRDFATFLSLLSGAEVRVPVNGWGTAGLVCNARPDRYGLSWRTLDGQFTRTSRFPYAVPQRRRRVFVVGYFGDWTRAAEVLLEPERLYWDTPSRFKARERITGIIEKSTGTAGTNNAVNFASSSFGNYSETDFGGTLKSSGGDLAGGSENLSVFGNGNDFAETLKTNCNSDRMPDKGKLNCVIERNDVTPIICLNDQGGSVMQVEEDGNAGTLRANSHGNEQIVCAGFLGTQGSKARGIGYSEEHAPTLRAGAEIDLLKCVLCCNSKKIGLDIGDNLCNTLNATDYKEPQVVCYANHANDSRVTVMGECCQSLTSRAGTGGGNLPLVQHAIAIAENVIGRKVENGGNGIGAQEELAYTQNATGVMGVSSNMTVRRLLPIECERLMGFPDNWTQIPWRGKPAEECPDAPRYKACGNSMCVNVMQWIGERIDIVDDELNKIDKLK